MSKTELKENVEHLEARCNAVKKAFKTYGKIALQLKSGFIHVPPCVYYNPRRLKKENWKLFNDTNELKEYVEKNNVKTTICSFCALWSDYL